MSENKPTVHAVTAIVSMPSKREPLGRLTYGFYTLVDGVLTMTDKDGGPAEDATGRRYTHRLAPNEDKRAVASRMTKELREAFRSKSESVAGFSGKINYPKRAVV
jgi:hypothetical protein